MCMVGPLRAHCCELDIPFCTQVGHAGPLWESGHGRLIPYLDRVTLDFPDLRIVGGHIDVPSLDEMLLLTTKCLNVLINTSAYKGTRYPKRSSNTYKATTIPRSCSARITYSGLQRNVWLA